MFLFHHSAQTESNATYYKGTLFEHFLKNVFERLGYRVSLRAKHNSLEYDIEGENIATSQKIIGEAKAHENTISGKDVSAFVGKLLPLGLVEKKVHGIFLSTSSFSPEAENFFGTLQAFDIKRFCGRYLYDLACEKLDLPKTISLEGKLLNGYKLLSDYVLVTDTGYYKVLICCSRENATPDSFFVFDKIGNQISEATYLSKLKQHTNELQDCEFVIDKHSVSVATGRVIEVGIRLSDDWTDYKLPAAPKFFIGRTSTLSAIDESIFKFNASLIQIKSRSGVGKSSLLAFLSHKYSKAGFNVELHDSRDIKSSLDIFLLVQRFTKSKNLSKDFKDVYDQVNVFTKKLSQKAFFLVDQFESTFTRKEIFETYESLLNVFQSFSSSIVVVIARKNDQLTTFDDTHISLDKINSLSKSVTLKDFEKDEAVELIKRITSAWGSKIDKEVLSYVLEFSQGFPWLIKRTMAHLLRQLNDGISQGDLIATGLKLDDLFNEELEGLDEIQLDYLYRIVQVLPASYQQLHKIFDEDPLLTKMLDLLTKLRLIRLSGSTYDTYNDVLKEYIVYKKLPSFKQKSLYRISATAAINNFHRVIPLEKFEIDDVTSTLKIAQGSAFNFIREWKTLNLVESETGGWKIPQIVLDVCKQGRLGDFVRREIAKNEPVSRILNILSQEKKMKEETLVEILKEEFPFLEISSATWDVYARFLVSWLLVLQLVEVDKESDMYVLPAKPRAEVVNDLGNLTNVKTGRRAQRDDFTPNTRYSVSLQLLLKLFAKKQKSSIDHLKLSSEEKKGFSDLKLGGWIEDGSLTVSSVEEFKEEASALLREKHRYLWDAAKNNGELLKVVKEHFGNAGTTSTMTYVTKVLLSWGKGLGIIENKRYKYSLERKKRNANENSIKAKTNKKSVKPSKKRAISKKATRKTSGHRSKRG